MLTTTTIMATNQKPQKHITTLGGKELIVFRSGFSPLSPFFPCKFTVNGVKFYTSHHYYLAKMARSFDDIEAEQEILRLPSPREAQQIAECINDFDEKKWRKMASDVLFEANVEKFRRSFGPRRFLLGTEKATIVFASTYDKELGNGVDYEDDETLKEENMWEGKNVLGKVLMRVREELQKK